MSAVELAAVLAATMVLASMLSVELGISVALLELGLGVFAGNAVHSTGSVLMSKPSEPTMHATRRRPTLCDPSTVCRRRPG